MARHTINSFLLYLFYFVACILVSIYSVNLFFNKNFNLNLDIGGFILKNNDDLYEKYNFSNNSNSTCGIEIKDLNNGYIIGKVSRNFLINTTTNFSTLYMNYNKIYEDLNLIFPMLYKNNYNKDINEILFNSSKSIQFTNKMLLNLITNIYCF